MAPVLVAVVAAVVGCGGDGETYSVEPTMKCLSAMGIRVVYWLPDKEAGDNDNDDPFPTSGGSLLARGAYDVNVRFGKDAAEAEAVAEKLEHQIFLDRFEGREYRLVVRRRSNAVVSARVPTDEEPDEQSLRGVLDAAEGCLRAA
jgi:hypothetical protein